MIISKTKKLFSVQRIMALAALTFLIVLSITHQSQAQTVTQGYGYDTPVQKGMIVKLKAGDATKVEAVDQSSAEQMYGVAVDANDAPVTLSNDGKKVFVASTGHFAVLVSDQNGTIAAGDILSVSAISGVGMKSDDKQPVIVGRALEAFDGKSGVVGSTQIKDNTGATHAVSLGRVQVDISVSRNPLLKATEPNLPTFLKKASEAIAGKPVNPVRVYIALVVLFMSTIVSGILLYGGVRSAIISIGRNPLSKKSILRGMFQVIVVAIIIFLCGIFGVYLLLKL